MSDFGLTNKGFKRKRFADIIAGMESQAKNLFGPDVNLSAASPLGIFIRLIAWPLATLWSLAEDIYNSAFIDSAEDYNLDKVGKYIGISRLPAQKAFLKIDGTPADVIISGQEGTFIPAGFLISTQDEVTFRTLENATIDGTGRAQPTIEAVEPGTSGNVAANTITVILNPISGVESVTNPDEVTGGRDEETNAEFRERYDKSISKGGSSTAESVEASLLELSGVRDALVEVNETMEDVDGIPPKSLAPTVFGGDNEEIAQAIFETKAGGIQSFGDIQVQVLDKRGNPHTIGFSRPTEIPIYVDIALTTNSNFPADGATQIRTDVIKHIGGLDADGSEYDGLGQDEDVIYTKIIGIVHDTPGVDDVTVQIGTDQAALAAANVPIGTREVATTDYNKVVVA